MSNEFIGVRNYTVHLCASMLVAENILGKIITNEQIDEIENKVWHAIQEAGVTSVGRRAIRSVIIQYISEEFGTQPLGHTPTHVGIKHVAEDAYKKYQAKGRAIRKEMYGSKK